MVNGARRHLYLDGSAIVKLVITERETESLRRYLGADSVMLASRVAEVEVRRVAARQREYPTEPMVAEVLAGTLLIELNAAIAHAAGSAQPPTLRSLDAIHLASALSVRDELEALVTYDLRLADAASAAGLRVASPD